MGSSTSCQTFKRFSRALQWILKYHFEVSGVTHLLDDFIIVGPAGKSASLNSLCFFEQLSQQLVRSLFLNHRFLSSETIKLYKGASSDTGFAAVFRKMPITGKWHRSFSSAYITLLELYPLVLVTTLFGWYLANHSIIFMTENSGVVEIVNVFRRQHVPGFQNVIH